MNDKKQLSLNKDRVSNLLDTFNTSEYSLLLLSSEFFFRRMDELKTHMPNAKFIAYVRNPMEIKESSYNQSVKRHFQLEKINTRRGKRLPYMARLVEFTDKFGTEDLYLRLYGDQYFKRGNIVSDLLSVLGVEVNAKLPVVNNSYQFEALEFKRWFNQFHLEDYQVIVDRALQSFTSGSEQYSLIPEDLYIKDGTYYACVLEGYTKKLNTSVLDPLIADMNNLTSKPYFTQKMSDEQFLSVCQYLQEVLQIDYYLMTKEVMSLTPIQNGHFHDLFSKSYSKKSQFMYLMLRGRNQVSKTVKIIRKAFARLF